MIKTVLIARIFNQTDFTELFFGLRELWTRGRCPLHDIEPLKRDIILNYDNCNINIILSINPNS